MTVGDEGEEARSRGGFAAAVYRLVRRVPRGRVITYGGVARALGRPGAARAVGHAMRRCPPGVPWHRVVNARGGISPRGSGSGMLTQRLRLEAEGVRLRRGRVPLDRHAWLPRRPAGPGERRVSSCAWA